MHVLSLCVGFTRRPIRLVVLKDSWLHNTCWSWYFIVECRPIFRFRVRPKMAVFSVFVCFSAEKDNLFFRAIFILRRKSKINFRSATMLLTPRSPSIIDIKCRPTYFLFDLQNFKRPAKVVRIMARDSRQSRTDYSVARSKANKMYTAMLSGR